MFLCLVNCHVPILAFCLFCNRLGEAEKALYHFKQSGPEADPDAMNKAKKVQVHLNKCTEAKRQRDWNTILKETGFSTAAGADSAPLVINRSFVITMFQP